MSRLAGIALSALVLLGPGCVTYVASTQGRTIDPEAVARLERGRTTLPEVLAILGAPQEVHQHTDCRLLVYRHRVRHTVRVGIAPSQALSALDLSQLTAEALSSLKLTVERTHAGEDRLVVLIDPDGVVQAVGYRGNTDELPVF